MSSSRKPEQISQDKQSQRLWVVGEVYYPEDTSTGFYMTAIAEGLANDFDVNVLCGQPNYARRDITAPRREFHNGVHIFRASGTRLDKNVMVYRMMNMLTLGLSIFSMAIRYLERGDQILVVTTPPNLPFIVAIAALARGASYTLLIHDCYPEQLVAVKALRPAGPAARTLDLLNRWLYKHARKLIVVGRDMRELMRRKTSGLNVPISVIPNWGEVESVRPAPRAGNSLLTELGLEDKFVFLHAGNIGRPTDVESIVDCAAMLADDDRFRFLFIGSGVKRSWIEKRIRENGLHNIVLLEPMPRSGQIEFLNACDVGLVALVDGMLGAAMPSKTYNILAAGKPVLALCHPDSELATVIDEEGTGWHIQPGDPERLRSLILEIYAQRAELQEMGTRARKAAEAKYRLATAIERYRNEMAVGLTATSNVAPAVDVARPLERS